MAVTNGFGEKLDLTRHQLMIF